MFAAYDLDVCGYGRTGIAIVAQRGELLLQRRQLLLQRRVLLRTATMHD